MQSSQPHIYWCVGFYASGSTWIFNAAKKVAAGLGLSNGLESYFAASTADLTIPNNASTVIVKTHELDGDAAEFLLSRSSAIWLSVRDPRDCVSSLITYQDCSFEEALSMTSDAASFCQRVAVHPRHSLLRFEDNFFDSEVTLENLARSFGGTLRQHDVHRIFGETRRSAIEAYIESFPQLDTVVTQPEPGHLVDLETQWHTHHAGRNGEVGRWRRVLTTSQISIINRRLAEMMSPFGYDLSH